MTDLLTSAQMRAIERAAMDSGAVTGRGLMERAGAGVVQATLAHWPGLAQGARRAVVLCGPGNNGGDGYVIARLLADRGWNVDLLALAEPGTPDAAGARADWPGPVLRLDQLPSDLSGVVVFDAVFGTGLLRPISREIGLTLAQARAGGARIVAVDILSGLCADSGRLRSDAGDAGVMADLTVTFDSPRPGHLLDMGGDLSGALAVADIGTGPWREALRGQDGASISRLATPVVPLRKVAGHKYAYGHALILSGGPGRGGAARLAARAALRVGAGLVTLAPPPAALAENAGRLDAIMLHPMPDGAALAQALSDPRLSALCLGPGLGVSAREVGLVAAALAARRPTVLDADALTVIARDPALRSALHEGCVLTPHDGEFARLFPEIAGALSEPPKDGAPAMSRLDAARAAAQEVGATVLLKGAATVIATPDGQAVVHAALRERAAPWLATAGAGDVLAGLIAGLLARGAAPLAAAQTGAWLHVEAARAFGPGLIAEDLPEALPEVLRGLDP